MNLFHKGAKVQWTSRDLDWESPVVMSERKRKALAHLLTPVYFGEQFASIFLPDIIKFFPFNSAQAVVATPDSFNNSGGGAAAQLDPNAALVVVLAWLVGALLVSALFTERAEISG